MQQVPNHPEDQTGDKDDFLNWRLQELTVRNNRLKRIIVDRGGMENWREYSVGISGKLMNRKIRSINGNRHTLQKLRIIHWNIGSKMWTNKLTEIEALITERKPDLFFVSESNLWEDVPVEARQIPGH